MAGLDPLHAQVRAAGGEPVQRRVQAAPPGGGQLGERLLRGHRFRADDQQERAAQAFEAGEHVGRVHRRAHLLQQRPLRAYVRRAIADGELPVERLARLRRVAAGTHGGGNVPIPQRPDGRLVVRAVLRRQEQPAQPRQLGVAPFGVHAQVVLRPGKRAAVPVQVHHGRARRMPQPPHRGQPAAQRHADHGRLAEPQVGGHRLDIVQHGAPRPRAVAGAAVTAQVDRDHAVPAPVAQAGGEPVPVRDRAAEAVQQHDGRARPAEVAIGDRHRAGAVRGDRLVVHVYRPSSRSRVRESRRARTDAVVTPPDRAPAAAARSSLPRRTRSCTP